MSDAEIFEGRYQTSDLIVHSRLDYIRAQITEQAVTLAEDQGKTLRAVQILPAEHDRTVFDPLNERWVVRWRAVLE